MKADEITKEIWMSAEEAFLNEQREAGNEVFKAPEEHDMMYHTDIWMRKDGKIYSIDVKNFSFQHGLFGFYFAESNSQWGNTQKEKIKADLGIEIAGEYIVIPYVRDSSPVWAIIRRDTLWHYLKLFVEPKYMVNGNPNPHKLLQAGRIKPRPHIWWYKMQAPYYGADVEKRIGIHVTREVFEKLVAVFKPRKTLIKSPSGELR